MAVGARDYIDKLLVKKYADEKVDNHDADMQRLLKNPQLAEVSDKMFNAACKAGVAYPEADSFATIDS